MKLSLILEAVDRMSAPAKKVVDRMKELTATATPAGKAIDGVGKAVDRVTAPAREAAAGLRKITDSTKPATKAIGQMDRQVTRVSASYVKWARMALRAAEAVDRTTDRVKALGRATALGAVWVGIKSFEVGAIGAGKALSFAANKAKEMAKWSLKWASIGVTAALGFATKGVISTGSKFEQFQAQLEGTEGSVQKARTAMSWVAKFAADTPYQIDEVTDAFVRARGIGIDPMSGAMTNLGDAAAGTRKSIMSAVEAIADAQSGGGFERLKEFNITTSVKGDKVTFGYLDKAGKATERTVTKSMTNVRQAILSVFDEKYGGGMMRQSRTLAGIWSNLQDKVVGFQLKVANAGAYDRVKTALADLLNWANKLDSNGTLDRWAKVVSENLSAAVEWGVKFVKSVDWPAVGKGIMIVARVLKWVAELLHDIVTTAINIGKALSWMSSVRTSDVLGLTASPVPAQPPVKGKRLSPPPASPDAWRRGITGAPKMLAAPVKPPAKPPLAPPVRGGQPPAKAAPAARPVASKSEINLHVTSDRGVTVRPTKIAAARDTNVNVNTGRAMGGFA